MKISVVMLSVTELQTAVREYVAKNMLTQPELVYVDNGYDKIVLTIPLEPSTVISGEEFRRET